MIKQTFITILLVFICFTACREEYVPRVDSLDKSFLVIEGNINPSASDSTFIRLSRTFKLTDTAKLRMESNAVVNIEGKDNSNRALIPRPNGLYVSAGLNLTIGDEYRLRIKTSDGKEYLSDYVKAKKTPLIDSINWDRDEDGVWIYANTHDPSNNTRYYLWEYDETWEIRSPFPSTFIYVQATNSVRNRVFPQEDVSVCWKYGRSTEILLANSTRLQNDVIYKSRLNLIPSKHEKLSVRYSTLVKQYALDKEAYNFLEMMKKNTEEIGEIFAPQPSELRGNIQCISDPSEYILGYITVSTVEQKRIFITTPLGWGFGMHCETKNVTLNPDSLRYYFGGGLYMPYAFNDPPPSYASSFPECVDCTKRNGSVLKPAYW